MEFQHPCNILVAGPTRAGKTEFVKKLVHNASSMLNPPPHDIYWCYSEWQQGYNEMMDKVYFIEGFPNENEQRKDGNTPLLLIIDDLMQDFKEKSLSKLFTKGTHHGNVTCIFIVQNLFYQGMRTSRVNSQYIILMKNPSDKLQSRTLGRQLFPQNSAYFLEAYEDACKNPYGYLLVDLSQETPENLRLRTQIFPGETQVVYTPKV